MGLLDELNQAVGDTRLPDVDEPLRELAPSVRSEGLRGELDAALSNAYQPRALEAVRQKASRVSPDQAAQIINLSRITRLPEAFVEDNLEHVQEAAKRTDFDPVGFAKKSPKMAEWLASNPYNLAVSLDDVQTLSDLEEAFSKAFYTASLPQTLRPIKPESKLDLDRRIAERIIRTRYESAAKSYGESVAGLSQDQIDGKSAEFDATDPNSPAISTVVSDILADPEMRDAYAASTPEQRRQMVKDKFVRGMIAPMTPTNQQIEEEVATRQERRKKEEEFIARQGEIGALEQLGQRGLASKLPFVGALADAPEAWELYQSAKALEAGTASEDQVDLLIRKARMQQAREFRGESFAALAADLATDIPAFAIEFGLTSGTYSAGKEVAKKAAKETVKGVIEGALRKVISSKAGQVALGAAFQAPLAFATRSPVDMIRRMTGDTQLTVSEAGELEAAITPNSADGFLSAFYKAAGSAYVEVLTERFGKGAEKIEGAIKEAVLGRWLKLHPREGVREFLTTVKSKTGWNGVIGEIFEEESSKAIQWGLGIEEYKATTAKEFLAEVVAFSVPGASSAILTTKSVERQKADRADLNGGVLENLTVLAANSKLNERDTVKFQEAVAKQVKDTDAENVYVAVETWNAYWQKQGVDPKEKALSFLGSDRPYFEATTNNQDLVIPTEVYAAAIAPEHGKFFQDEVRFNPTERNRREAKEYYEQEKAKEEAAAKEKQGKVEDAERTEAQAAVGPHGEIEADIAAQLSAAKRPASEVETSPMLWSAIIKTMSAATGQDPAEVYRRYRPQIQQAMGVEEGPAGSMEQAPAGVEGSILMSPSISGETEQGPTIREALGALTSARHADIKKTIQQNLSEAGIEANIISGLGDTKEWGSENSYHIEISKAKSFDDIRYQAAVAGRESNQKAVIPFVKEPGGPDRLHTLKNVRGKLSDVRKALDAAGLEFRNLRGEKGLTGSQARDIVIFDKGNKLDDKILEFGRQHAEYRTVATGRGEFLGGKTRAEGLRAYTRVIQDYRGTSRRRGGSDLAPGGEPGGQRAVGAESGGTGGRERRFEQPAAGPLRGLPEDSAGPDHAVRAAAERYAQQAGIDYRQQAAYAKADPVRGKRIAEAYEALKHSPSEESVKAAYRALIDETKAQFQVVKALGLKIEAVEPGMADPYQGQAAKLIADVRAGHLWFFPTSGGFGSGSEVTDHPMLEPTTEQIGTRVLLANDVFRIVHDIFGHVKEGVTFGPHGEENAWQSHVRMYSPLAARAMTTETRGQNSWVNFGPHGEQNRKAGAKTIYAEQKAALMPEWVMTEGLAATRFEQKGARGSVEFGLPGMFARILLLRKADRSTFLHESAHVFLEMMGDFASAPGAPAEVVNDYQEILKFLGVGSRAEIKTEQHEKWARAFERYLGEGKAPSVALRPAFQRFKAWIISIYEMLTNLGVELTPEVRGVMDRMLATKEEIAQAEREQERFSISDAAKEIGMSPADAEDMERSAVEAHAAGEEAMLEKLIAEAAREDQAAWQEQREAIRAEVEKEVSERRVYVALDALQGEDPTMKLNRTEVERAYGENAAKFLPRGIFADETPSAESPGKHPDTIAQELGYESGEALLESIRHAPKKDRLIDQITDARMVKEHGDLMSSPDEMKAEAMRAIHSEKRAQLLKKELEWLAKNKLPALKQMIRKITGKVPRLEEVRAEAEALIAGKLVKDIRPNVYQAAEARAAKAAREALLRGDFEAAFQAKQDELISHERFVAASDAREEIDKALDYLKKFTKKSTLERIGKLGPQFVSQIVALLERYDLKPLGPVATAKKAQTLQAFYEEMRGLGFEPAIGAVLMDEARSVSYKDVSLDEVRDLRDAIKSIVHIARKHEDVDYEKLVERLVEAAKKNLTVSKEQLDVGLKRWKDKSRDRLVSGDTLLIPMESIFEELDGGALGEWHDALWNRSSTAQADYLDMIDQIQRVVSQKLDAYREGNPDSFDDKIQTPLGMMSRNKLISIAFNMGNESNYDKLVRGYRWKDRQLDLIKSVGRLSTRDLKLVQDVWDTLDLMFPKLAALQERVSGIPLKRVEPRSLTLTTVNGEIVKMKGGYFPLVYDPRLSDQGREQESGPLAGLVDKGYAIATIPSSARKERTGFAAPILLDWTKILQRHLVGVIKDLTYREFLMDSNRLLRDHRIRQVLQERLGTEYEEMFLGSEKRPGWLRHVANEHISYTTGLDDMDRLAEKARSNVVVVALGYKVASTMAQFAGLSNSLEYVRDNYGAKFFFSAMKQFYKNPALNVQKDNPESLRYIIEHESGEMRHRFQTLDRDMMDAQRKIKQGKFGVAKEMTVRASMYGIGFADMLVAMPTYIAAKNGALAKGATKEQAIHAGEAAVRRSQGAGGAKDLAAVQRKRGVAKLLTMFLTPFMAQYGRMRSVQGKLGKKGLRYAPEALVRLALITSIPAIVSELLAGRGPDEDKDKAGWLQWLSVKSSMGVFAGIPFIRDIANFVENRLLGKPVRDTRFSPVVDAMEKAFATGTRATDATFGDGEWTDELGWDAFESAGYFFGLPTGQASITGEYLLDLVNGETDADSPFDFLHDLVFRRTKKEREGR